MSGVKAFLARSKVSWFDEREWLASDRFSSFAWSDVFLREISPQKEHVLVHIWPMESTVILGMLDKQLPFLELGLSHLKAEGYRPVVRNIGGLAVVADQGVLNFSLIFSQKERALGIKEAYEWLLEVVRELFGDCPRLIEAYEISQSYCPGDYDLSVGGRKIAGLAQRRIKDGILVSIYLSVSGNQARRCHLIREFYQLAKQGQATKSQYPEVNPEAMTTIEEVYGRIWSVEEVCERLLTFLNSHSQSVAPYRLGAEALESYQTFYQDMQKRNKEVMAL